MSSVSLGVTVPVCSFRKPYAREFLESERIPPPATVYGFLLSLVGEDDRHAYIGTRLAISVTKSPATSLVLRTAWRVKKSKKPLGTGPNRRPDYQEILSGLQIGVWIAAGDLATRVREAKSDWKRLNRYGGLSLGESRDLVDEVVFDPAWDQQCGNWLCTDARGPHPLPVWVDHVGSKGTRWTQFRIERAPLIEPPQADSRWINIVPPDGR